MQKKNIRKRQLAFFTALLICISTFQLISVAESNHSNVVDISQIEQYVDDHFKVLKTPGLSIAILSDGEVHYINRGVTDLETENKVNQSTNYELCSLSKAFTGFAIQQLISEGQLELSDPVSKYLNFQGNWEGKTYDITVEQLLHHTSGIASSDLKYLTDDRYTSSLLTGVTRLSGIELSSLPGTKFEYTSVNYDVLGALIEVISGQSYKSYIEEQILKPLNMNHSYVGARQKDDSKALGHKITFFSPKVYTSPFFTANTPAGYIFSNTEDMMKWAQFQFSDGDLTVNQQVHQPNLSISPQSDAFYASGWFKKISSDDIFFHSGSNPGYRSYISVNQTKKNALIILSNSNSDNFLEFSNALDQYLNGGDLMDITRKAGGIDTVFSGIVILISLLFLGGLGFLLKVAIDVKRKKRSFEDKNLELRKLLIYIITTIPVFYGMYIIPQVSQNTDWYMISIWLSDSVVFALLYTVAFIVFSYFLYSIHLFFPTKNEYFKNTPELVVLGVVSGICNAITILIVTYTINGIFNPIYLLYYFVLSLSLYILCRRSLEIKLAVLTQTVIKNTKEVIFKRLFSSSYEEFIKIKEGELTAVLTTDIDQISQVANLTVTIVTSVITIIAAFIYLATISWVSTLAIVVVIAVVASVYGFFNNRARTHFQKSRETQSVFLEKIEGLIQGFKDISLQSKKKKEYIDEVIEVNKSFMNHNVNAFKIFVNAFLLGESFFIIVLGMVAFGLSFFITNASSAYVSMQFVIVLIYLLNPINGVLNSIPRIARIRISINKIKSLINKLPEKETEGKNELLHDSREIRHLYFDKIEYTYSNSDELGFKIGPISLDVQKGEIYFIIGGNGSGKSTLIHLITGLFQSTKGRVLVDGNENHAINRGESISAVFSDSYLFDHLYNADLTNKAELIKDYLLEFHLFEKVKVENGKFSTVKLSTGQKKRLHLLRVILEDKPIFIFDELAADQDPQFRLFFYRTLLPRLKSQGKIVLAVTHDDHYFDIADKVIKLNLGQVEDMSDEYSV